jgi:D-glycero-D-manno-heptose 1,7-bisphosphate phosphatase
MPQRFVLLDRDGTLIAERHYLARVEDIEILPNTVRGLRLLRDLDLGLVVVTNQSGLNRGYFNAGAVDEIHSYLKMQLSEAGIELAGIYVCPHTPDEGCTCRKPEPGLAHRAAGECNFDPTAAFVIGDKWCDIELGKRLGSRTLLVRTGYGAQSEREGVRADHIVADVLEAAQVICDLTRG